jgi:hypothetical protein
MTRLAREAIDAGCGDWYWIGWVIGWRMALQAFSIGGRLFRLCVDSAWALCNHSLRIVYGDVSLRRRLVKKETGYSLTTIIVDITITATLVRATEHAPC